MRFKTFRMLLIGGLAVGGIGGLVAVSTCCKKDETAAKPEVKAAAPGPKETTAPKPTPTPTPAPTPTPTAASDGLALRPMDQQILDYLAKPATTDKVKDAFPGQTWKANIYRENGAAKFNRVKIDLNRNEKWDEKWSVETDGGQEVIKRQVAPADDEKYTEEYRLKAGKWVKK